MVGIEAQAAGLCCLFSDKVSREADVGDGNEFLPLDAEAWAQALAKPRTKQNNTEKLRAAHFDIETEAHRLSDFYDMALRGKLPPECN